MRAVLLMLALSGCSLFDTKSPKPSKVHTTESPSGMVLVARVQSNKGVAQVVVSGGTPHDRIHIGVSAFAGGERECKNKRADCYLLGKPLLSRHKVTLDDKGTGELDIELDGVDASNVLFIQGAALDGGQARFTNLWARRIWDSEVEDDDGDGLSNNMESSFGTDASNPDSDGDGLQDGWEYALRTDPKASDSDKDGLDDGEEWLEHRSVPSVPDTDNDGLNDGKEVKAGTSPSNPDSDNDGAPDSVELRREGADPKNPDVDGDGILDGADGLPFTKSKAFTPNDRLAIAADATVPDPEFEFVQGLVTWSSLEGEKLWVARIDPETKLLDPPDGRGTLIDERVAPISALANGPEWAQGPNGPHIVYAKGKNPRNVRVAHAWQEDGVWKKKEFPDTLGGGSPFGTLLPGDPDPKVLYCFECERFTDRFTFRYFHLLDPSKPHVEVKARTTMGRWTEDTTGLVLQGFDDNDVSQITLHDVATGKERAITENGRYHHLSFMWDAPEVDGKLLFYVVGREEVPNTYMQVLHMKPDGSIESVKQVHPPMGFPYVVSPEPVVFKGKSYISYLASTGALNRSNGDSEVWLAGAAPGEDFARRLSDTNRMIRKDPESLIIGGDLVVYYSEVTKDGRRLTHVVDSGL